jgi:hypothetical protein
MLLSWDLATTNRRQDQRTTGPLPGS